MAQWEERSKKATAREGHGFSRAVTIPIFCHSEAQFYRARACPERSRRESALDFDVDVAFRWLMWRRATRPRVC
jgi:hypothetical protein